MRVTPARPGRGRSKQVPRYGDGRLAVAVAQRDQELNAVSAIPARPPRTTLGGRDPAQRDRHQRRGQGQQYWGQGKRSGGDAKQLPAAAAKIAEVNEAGLIRLFRRLVKNAAKG